MRAVAAMHFFDGGHARGIDQHVQAAKTRERLVHGGAGLGFIAHIGGLPQPPFPLRVAQAQGVVVPRCGPVGNQHPCTGFPGHQAHRCTQAGTASGHQHHTIRQLHSNSLVTHLWALNRF